MTPCNKSPWYRLGRHGWDYTADEAYRTLHRAVKPFCWIMGTFECREVRTCRYCNRAEHRDTYGGNYRPYNWTLRGYRKTIYDAAAREMEAIKSDPAKFKKFMEYAGLSEHPEYAKTVRLGEKK